MKTFACEPKILAVLEFQSLSESGFSELKTQYFLCIQG
jgi:hypothetical protein